MRPDQDVSLPVQGRVFAALFSHLRLDKPDVVAHDFGGCAALRGYLLHGCDYRSLTLIDPVALAPWGSPFVHHVREHERAFAGLPPYIHAAIVPAYIAGAAFHPLSARNLQLYVAPWLGAAGPAPTRILRKIDRLFEGTSAALHLGRQANCLLNCHT